MTEAPEETAGPPPPSPPTKRRKLSEEPERDPLNTAENGAADRKENVTSPLTSNGPPVNARDSADHTYPTAVDPDPTRAAQEEPQPSIVRGPQVTGGLDEVRPPRREARDDRPSPPPPYGELNKEGRFGESANSNNPESSLGLSKRLDPEIEKVLAKIFASGLFQQKDVDGRALDFLGSVSVPHALAALEDIQRRDFSTVRNKPAFIMSIFKRVVAGMGNIPPPPVPPPGGFPPTSVPPSALAHLAPAVSDALQRVFTSGVCHPSQFDDRAMDILVDLQEADAVRALSEFAAMEPGRVRNPSAFWMGLARKYKNHARAPGGRMGPPVDGGHGGPGGGYTPYDSSVDSYTRRLGGGGGSSVAGSGTGGYSATLEQRLDELSATGQLPRSALDDRALEALRRLPEQDGLAVLNELPELARVRNMSAYVMGLCKKFATGEARSLANRTGGYGGGGYAGGAYGGSYAGGGGYGGAYGGGYNNTYGNSYASAPTAAPYPTPTYGVGTSAVPPSTYGSTPQQHADPATRAREVREALEKMDSAVKERFYSMTDQGVISETSFDARAIEALRNMRREDACSALDELAASEPGRIHNISAYFMGLAKKFGRQPM